MAVAPEKVAVAPEKVAVCGFFGGHFGGMFGGNAVPPPQPWLRHQKILK